MKKLVPIVLSVLVMASCASIDKNMQRGNYDQVIQKSVKKLIKKPKAKYAEAMDRAYMLANERDLERVTFLEREDNPAYYDELFQRYAMLKERQSQVRRVTPITVEGKTYSYEYVDYDAKIISSKKKAAEELYSNGKDLLMNARSKLDYREANAQLLRAAEYGRHLFPDIDDLIHESRIMGISRVIVLPDNLDPKIGVPKIDLEEMVAFDPGSLDGNPWVEYHFSHVGGDIRYDYELHVRILSIDVSDDIEKESQESYTRKSSTKFDYALDASGNVMKDTAGNDIKIYKDVTATLVKKERLKTAQIRGEVETISISGEPIGSLMKVPFTADGKFENVSYTMIGDQEALDPSMRELVKKQPLPFPTETELVKLCIQNAKPKVKALILDTSRRHIQ